MIFNEIEKEYLTVTRGRKRPAWAPVDRELITVTGMSGAHLSHSKRQVREIAVPVFLMAESFSDLQKLKEDMADWLIHDEPKKLVFKDEPDRTYYAVVDGGLDLDELVRWGEGVITFICPDPYKYGPEKTLTFPADIVKVENEGTAAADPIFEMTARKKATFAMIANGDDEDAEYNLIGAPADVDEQLVDEKTLLFTERGETISDWSSSGAEIDGGNNVTGSFTTDGTGIVVNDFGTAEWWHGPAVMKEIDPIQDFEIEMRLRAETKRPEQAYRIEFYLFDENMKSLGKMAVWDNSTGSIQYAAEGRYGPSAGKHQNFAISSQNYQRNRGHFHGVLRLRRVGQEFEFYVARIGVIDNFTHHDSFSEIYRDAANEFQGKLKYIQVHIGQYGDNPVANVPRINMVRAYEINTVLEDQTPYILFPEDVVTFDHKNDDVLVNGEVRPDLNHTGAFGGSFFKLKKGENMLIVTPEDTFDTKVTFRDKFL